MANAIARKTSKKFYLVKEGGDFGQVNVFSEKVTKGTVQYWSGKVDAFVNSDGNETDPEMDFCQGGFNAVTGLTLKKNKVYEVTLIAKEVAPKKKRASK